MIRSLVSRITLLQQAMIIVAMLGFALATLWGTHAVLGRGQQRFVDTVALHLATSFDDELTEDPDVQAAAIGVIEDANEAAVHAEIRDTAGRLMASTEADTGASGAVPPRATDGGAPPQGGRRDFVAHSQSHGGVGITVWASGDSRSATLKALAKGLLIAALPTLLLSLLLSRTVVARALLPLSAMAKRATNLSVERKPRSLGLHAGLVEIDQLGRAFDTLLERLDDAMSAERRLTADASHELRTPLTALSGELELLVEQSRVDGTESRGLRLAADHVRAMRELVEAILLLHRSGETAASDAAALEAINLCDLTRETLAEVLAARPERRPDVGITAPDELLVDGNVQLLASAVRNLIDNALKFTQPGQRVEIAVTAATANALLIVDDAGAGVREDERDRIFDPFVRGAVAGTLGGATGYGLGLPIMRRVARAHGGDVTVSRSALGGARFELRLPRRG